MKFKVFWLATITVFMLGIPSCKKDEKPASGDINVQMSYHFDGATALLDTLAFAHPAGYTYSLNRLQFYLSGFEFTNEAGGKFSSSGVLYFDMKKPEFSSGMIAGVPGGTYTSVRFYLGLDSIQNKSNALPATTENINMAWPDGMGGGYHFMKLEGYYKNNAGTYGYAMHLGRNPNLVVINLPLNHFKVNGNKNFRLIMNIQEWFKNPAIYDFDTDGNYSMGSMVAMNKLKNNGADVFTVDFE